MKKAITLILALILTLSVMTPAMATEGYTPQHTDAADTLYELGLFAGTGTDADGNPTYELDRTATRLEGIVMLLRLLGEIDDAKAYEGTSPFTDVPDWGQKFVNYAYYKGYTSGVSATEFGSNNELLGKAYLTFVLRALGYSDKGGADFTYNDALTKAAEVGLIEEGECEGAIYRDDCANASLTALATPLKDSETTLAEKLIDAGVLDEEAVEDSGILKSTVNIPCVGRTLQYDDLYAAFPEIYRIASSGYGGGITYSTEENREYTIDNIFFANPTIRDYCIGKTNSFELKDLGRDTGTLKWDDMFCTFFTLLDKHSHMIGYAIVPYNHIGDYIEFVRCDYFNAERIEELRTNSANLNSQKIKANDAVYIERITTILADGTEETVERLIIDEVKSGFSKDAISYYCLTSASRGLSETWYREEQGYFVKKGTEHSSIQPLGIEKSVIRSQKYLFVYDESFNFLGYYEFSKDIPVVETVVNGAE